MINTTGKKKQTPGQRIRQLRLELEMEQKELADKVAVILESKGIISGPNNGKFSQPALSRYEQDKVTKYPLAQMEAIAEVLGTSAEYLLGTLDSYSHHKDEIREWLQKQESAIYVEEAYFNYIRNKGKEE